MKLTRFIIPLFLTVATVPATAQILNGSFETPTVDNLSVLGIGLLPGSEVFTTGSGVTDWTVGSGDVTIVNAGGTLTSLLGLFTPDVGNQYAVLNGLTATVSVIPLEVTIGQTGSAGVLNQAFTTTPGRTYQISFAYRGLAVGVLTNNPALDVSVSNATSSTAPANGLLTANISLGAWQTESFQFVATGTSSTLSFFQNSGGVDVGLIGLDNVVLTPLPEPWQYGCAAVAFLGLLIGGRVFGEKLKVES